MSFGLPVTQFWNFRKKDSAGLSKLNSTSAEQHIEKIVILEKKHFFNQFPTSSKKNRYSAKTFRQGCQNLNLRVPWNVLKRFSININFFHHFITSSGDSFYFQLNFFWKGCQNGILHAQRKVLKGNVFCLKKLFFLSISDFHQKCFGPLTKISQKGCQN